MSGHSVVVVVAGKEVDRDAVLSMCQSHADVEAAIIVSRLDEAVAVPVEPIAIIVSGQPGTSRVSYEELLLLARSGTAIVIMGATGGSPADDPVLQTVAVYQIPADAPVKVLHQALDKVIAHRSSTAASNRSEAEEQDPARVDRPQLSGQEERTLQLYASGLKLVTVARLLGVKPSTAKEYIERVREKYKEAGRPAQSKFDLRLRAIEDGYLER